MAAKYQEKFMSQIQVKDVSLTKIRIGNKHDGGYVLLKELCEKTSMLYSFGIGNDVGFELDFTKKYPLIGIQMYDPTVSFLPSDHFNFTFHKIGIEESLNNLQDDCILKIDVEHAEWDALLNISTDDLLKCNQIVVEFHIIHCEPRHGLTPYFREFYRSILSEINEKMFKKYYQVMKKLTDFFYIYHIHPNNSLPKTQMGYYYLPPLIELSFVRKDLVKGVCDTRESFPIQNLDYPNKTNRSDITNFYPLGMGG